MPLVLAPNTWRIFYNPKGGVEKERSHGDGIKIGLDSNEALEEYFFKAVTNDSFIHDDKLVEHKITNQQYDDYLSYQAIVRGNSEKIYLAKNNNLLLRYHSLREHNSAFTAVMMFRHPLYHAKSLLAKHLEFSEMQKHDGFMLEYMDWLGHHEFGLNHKPFYFSKEITGDTSKLDYWLQVWINYYSKALDIECKNTMWVSYDAFCSRPSEVIEVICNKVGLESVIPKIESHSNTRKVDEDVSSDLLNDALNLYDQLLSRSI